MNVAHLALAVAVVALVFALIAILFALDWVAAEDLACDRLRREVAGLRAELAGREAGRPCRTCRPNHIDSLDTQDRGPWAD